MQKLIELLNKTFPVSGDLKHHIVLTLKPKLGVAINNEFRYFEVKDKELLDPEKLVADILALLEQEHPK